MVDKLDFRDIRVFPTVRYIIKYPRRYLNIGIILLAVRMGICNNIMF